MMNVFDLRQALTDDCNYMRGLLETVAEEALQAL